jgi:hypothetical protein
VTWWIALGLALSLYGAFVVLEWIYGRVLQIPAGSPPSLSIVLHVLDQEGAIEQTMGDLAALWRDGDWHRGNVELIIADGGSQDQTLAIAGRLQRRYPFLVVAEAGLLPAQVLDLCGHDVIVWVEMRCPSVRKPLDTLRALLVQAAPKETTAIS